jgi:hypothetical protein
MRLILERLGGNGRASPGEGSLVAVNWVTHKRALAGLTIAGSPIELAESILLETSTLLNDASFVRPRGRVDGIPSHPLRVSGSLEQLVTHSGKPADGIYSNFNQRLCRPMVRLLPYTRVTPNAITVAAYGAISGPSVCTRILRQLCRKRRAVFRIRTL